VSDYPADFANEPDKHWYKQAQTLEIQRNAFARYKGTAMQRHKFTRRTFECCATRRSITTKDWQTVWAEMAGMGSLLARLKIVRRDKGSGSSGGEGDMFV